jgi:2-aminoadipate transaminase
MGAAPPPPLFELDEAHAIVIRLSTFSKMLAPGLRLGWITAVPPIVEQLALIKQRVDPHTQNLAQFAVADLITTGVFDRYLATLRAEHRRRCDAMVQALRSAVPAGDLRFAVPSGGLYLWCQLPAAAPARAVQQEALRDAVVFLTGEPFYVDRGGSHELRLCFAAQRAELAPKAAASLARSIAAVRRTGQGRPALMPVS